jgi:hypothetical protein
MPTGGVRPEKIKEWLQTTGIPFEMSVAQTLLKKGLGTQQGHYYIDPDDPTTSREVDVIATQSLAFAENAVIELVAVIECKYAPTPWVLYRGPRTGSGPAAHFNRIASEYGAAWLKLAMGIPQISSCEIWQREDGVGYALGTSNPTGQGEAAQAKDLAYKATLTVAKASLALAEDLTNRGGPVRRVAVLLPVIVIRGQLFEATLDGADIAVNEIDRGQMDWSYPASATGRVLVDVLTEAALEQLADEMGSAFDAITEVGTYAGHRAINS